MSKLKALLLKRCRNASCTIPVICRATNFGVRCKSELVRLREVFDQWQTHLEPSSLEAALTQAETWTLGEAITYALKNDN
jgi:hypothetical protein